MESEVIEKTDVVAAVDDGADDADVAADYDDVADDVAKGDADVINDDVGTDQNPVLCPFVCGICSAKFDKVSKFYAHLKKHSNFDALSQKMGKKSEMLEALNVSEKADENLFTCGICNVDFPSMSLLHQHMVEEEQISSYNYCEVDHTARVNKPNDNQETADPPKSEKRGRGRPRKYPLNLTPSKPVSPKSTEEGSTAKSKRGRKRKVGVMDDFDDDGEKVCEDSANNSALDNTDDTILSPRKSSRRSTTRIDYKMLAGFGKGSDDDEPSQAIKAEKDDPYFEVKKAKLITPLKTITPSARRPVKIVDPKTIQEPKIVYVKLDGSEEPVVNENTVEESNEDMTTVVELEDDDVAGNLEDEAAAETFKMLSNIDEDGDVNEGEELDSKEAEVIFVNAETQADDEEDEISGNVKKSVLYSCSKCGVVLSLKAMRKHRLSHLTSASVRCGQCPKRFKSLLHLSHHKRSVHSQKKMKCPKCLKVIKGKQAMDRHIGLHILKKEIDAKAIDEVQWKKIDDDDEDEDIKNDDFIAFGEPQEMEEFDMEDIDLELVKQYKAGKLFKKSLKEEDDRVQCVLCLGVFKNYGSFRRHMTKIHLCQKFKCKICDKMIRTRKRFQLHIKEHKMIDHMHHMKKAFGGSGVEKDVDKADDVANAKEEDDIDMDELAEIDEVKETKEVELDGSSDDKQTDKVTADNIRAGEANTDEKNEMDQNSDEGTENKDQQTEMDENELEEAELIDQTEGKVIVVQVNKKANKQHQLQCEFCPYVARSHDMLAKHQIIHSEAVNQICEICDRVFDSVVKLTQHKMEKHNVTVWTCNICGEQLKGKQTMTGHRAKHLISTDKYYSKEVVEKLQKEMEEEVENRVRKYRSRASGSDRPRGNQLVECTICGNHVKAIRLQRHLEIHVETKEFECNICGKFYKSMRYLKDHLKKTHEKGKDAVCQICGNSYKGQRYLEIHMQTHGPKDKICPYCGKGFTTAVYLKTHLQTHLEKKSFKCKECDAGFSHRTRLMIHLAEAHGHGEKKACKYCRQMFPSRQKARMHERRMHEGFKHKKRVHKGKHSNMEYYIVNKSSQNGGMMIQYYKAADNDDQETQQVQTINLREEEAETEVTEEINQVAEKEETLLENEFELVEVTAADETGSIVIQEISENGETVTREIQSGDQKNLEHQVLEIPEEAEQCQLILYPDGTFKLLNVLDPVKVQEEVQAGEA